MLIEPQQPTALKHINSSLRKLVSYTKFCCSDAPNGVQCCASYKSSERVHQHVLPLGVLELRGAERAIKKAALVLSHSCVRAAFEYNAE